MERAASFVSRREPYCVSLAEEVRTGGKNVFLLDDMGQTAGVISAGSTLFHCIPKMTSPLQTSLFSFFKKRERGGHKTQCITGEAATSAFFEHLLCTLGKKPQDINHYHLLSIKSIAALNSIIEPHQDLRMVRCASTLSMIDALVPVQIAYIKEEVLPKCRHLSAAAVRLKLEKALRLGRVAVLLDGKGNIVSKVSLNAAGFNCVQLGGVYTMPSERKKGLAAYLVGSAVKAILQSGHQIVLYVKEENTAARNLYQKIGFAPLGKFSIIYY